MKNQDGYIIIVAVMMLALISLLGITAMKQTMAELQIVGNHNIHQRCFWHAESGAVVGVSKLPELLITDSQVELPIVDWEGYLENLGSPPFYKVWVNHKLKEGEVLYYGDIDNDYLMEYNTDQIGWPVEIITSEGTDYRGGEVVIEVEANYIEIFPKPKSALWVGGDVSSSGVAGKVIGEGPPGHEWECPNKTDILYHDPMATIDFGGDLGSTPAINQDSNLYPYPLIKNALVGKATRLTETDYSSESFGAVNEPGIYYAPGNLSISASMGYGILMVEGNLQLKGAVEWEGIIIVGGDFSFSGGGDNAVYGSVIVMGNVDSLLGSVDIYYDCESLEILKNTFSSYRRVSWRQL